MRLPKIVLTLLCLTTLSACSTAPVTVPQPVKMYPEEQWTRDTPEPPMLAKTCGELADYAVDLQSAIRACNVDKGSIRTWSNESE